MFKHFDSDCHSYSFTFTHFEAIISVSKPRFWFDEFLAAAGVL